MINFSKMHGLGNDFMVIDNMDRAIAIDKLPIKQLAHRYLGVGFDQLLVIEPSNKADFLCRIFNADGGEAEQCGNGLRCIIRFIHDKKLTPKKSLTLETKAGIFSASIFADMTVQVTMGVPNFQPEKIPFKANQVKPLYELKMASGQPLVKLAVISMGNPHAVMQVASIKNFPVAEMGAQIAKHDSFPQSVNVGFMEIINREQIRLRTYERGAGETFSCGSNACAAVVAGIINNVLEQKVKVELTFGDLWVEWQNRENPVMMTGPATPVFDGNIRVC